MATPRTARAALPGVVLSALVSVAFTPGCAGDVLGSENDLGSAGAPAVGGESSGGADPTAGQGGRAAPGSGGSGASVPAGGTGEPGASGAPATPVASPQAFGTCPDSGAEPGPTPLMKLSTLQYRNTVRDLLRASGLEAVAGGLTTRLAAVPDDSSVAFRGLDKRISSDHLKAYFDVATAVAEAATESDARLGALAGSCATTTPLSASCLDSFLESFGLRAFRRPLNAGELAEFRDIARGSSPQAADNAEALRNVVVVMLMSPRFVNHLELEGSPIAGRSDLFQLDPFEVASRLSYTFWQTLPDDALLAAAEDGSLSTTTGFDAQLDRVFTDPRTQQTLWQFWNEWLRFESFTGFAAERPAFQSLAEGEFLGVAGHDHWADMVQEMRELTDLYMWKEPGSFRNLMTSTVSVTRSPDLARLYDVPVWNGTGAYPSFDPDTRSGLLQRAALLVSTLETTNPFHRGSVIRRSILCDDLPQPDPNSLPEGALDAPPPSAALTTRERYAAKVDGNPLCNACHAAFSDIGYVLESFDALGRFRTEEKVFDEQTGELIATLPLDTSAELEVISGDRRLVSGPAELNQLLLDSGKVEACLSAHYFRYALRRDPTRDSEDACAFEAMRRELLTPDAALAGVFRRIAQAAGFRQRKVASP